MILENKQEIELAQQYGLPRSTVQEVARAFADMTPLTHALLFVSSGHSVDMAIWGATLTAQARLLKSQEAPF